MLRSAVVVAASALVVSAHFDSSEDGGRRPHWPRPFPSFGRHGGGWGRGFPSMPPPPPHGPWGGPPPHHHGPPPPPFLRNVTEEARKEFFQIFEDSTQTKAQVKERVQEWVSKQDAAVQESARTFHTKMEAVKEEARQNATAVIMQLQLAFDRFAAVLDDQSLNRRETEEKMKSVARSFDKDVIFAVKMIAGNARRRIMKKHMPKDRSGFGSTFPFPPPPPPPPHPEDPFFPSPPLPPAPSAPTTGEEQPKERKEIDEDILGGGDMMMF